MTAPPLPPGRHVELPGRGTTFVREVPGPPGAPAVVLLHGWTANADLNWFPSYEPLGRRYRVVALDHRGHGRGIRSRRPFRLESCADDVAALVDVLGLGPVVATGYSMGGPVAQLLWRRHPNLVRGLVLCATARSFAGTSAERAWFAGLGGMALAARVTPKETQRRLAERVMARRPDRRLEAWAVEEMHRNDWTAILEAGRSLGRFSSSAWLPQVDVPAAVVLTTADRVVPPGRQRRLAETLPDVTVHPVGGDHDVCVSSPGLFVPVLLDAIGSVLARSGARAGA